MIAIVYDDRPAALTGVKLAVLSLRRHLPDVPIRALTPGAPEAFVGWASGVPGLEVDREPGGLRGAGWNVKPTALLAMFAEGHDEVLWIDSDIVVTGDLGSRLGAIPPSTMVLTEEYYWGHAQGGPARTEALGFPVGRTFPTTLNSGVIRATPAHAAVLEAWNEILASPQYLAAQSLPAVRKPLHFLSDQEVLTGVLGAQAFAGVPVVALRRGRDIAQCFGPSGFTPLERIRSARSLPLAVHAMGAKPWMRTRPVDRTAGRFLTRAAGYYEQLHQELTPYVAAARAYRDQLDEDTSWMDPDSRVGRFLRRAIAAPALTELPIALVDTAQRRVRRWAGIRQLTPGVPSP